MASPAQIAANQLNAQKSTGPRTPEGKTAVRFNALRHGADAQSLVLPGEDPAELQAIQSYYHDRFQPRDPHTQTLVAAVIHATWTLRRLHRAETAVLTKLMQQADNDLGQAYLNDANGPNLLPKLARQIVALERTRQKSLAALYQLYPNTPPPLTELNPKLALFRRIFKASAPRVSAPSAARTPGTASSPNPPTVFSASSARNSAPLR
jgi:hypothetical protein